MNDLIECVCGEKIEHAAWTTHLMTAGRHASTDATMFHPRDGLPGAREIHNRTKTALETLKTRGIAVNVNAAMANVQIAGVIRALMEKGFMTQPEFEYYAALAQCEGLENIVVETTPKPRIVLPGQN